MREAPPCCSDTGTDGRAQPDYSQTTDRLQPDHRQTACDTVTRDTGCSASAENRKCPGRTRRSRERLSDGPITGRIHPGSVIRTAIEPTHQQAAGSIPESEYEEKSGIKRKETLMKKIYIYIYIPLPNCPSKTSHHCPRITCHLCLSITSHHCPSITCQLCPGKNSHLCPSKTVTSVPV